MSLYSRGWFSALFPLGILQYASCGKERSFCFKVQGNWASPDLFWEYPLRRRPAGKLVRKRGCWVEFSEKSQNNPAELRSGETEIQKPGENRASEQQLSDEDFECHNSWAIHPAWLYPRWRWRKELFKHSWGEWEIIEKEGIKVVQHQVWLFLVSNALTSERLFIGTDRWPHPESELRRFIRCADGIDSPLEGKTWLQPSNTNNNFH